MIITMLETRRGSPNGFDIVRYYKDVVYDIPDELARHFLRSGYAERVKDLDNNNFSH